MKEHREQPNETRQYDDCGQNVQDSPVYGPLDGPKEKGENGSFRSRDAENENKVEYPDKKAAVLDVRICTSLPAAGQSGPSQ